MVLSNYFISGFFFLFFCLFARSQESIHKKYNTSNGLVSNTIFDIRQDKNGYLWIATDLGLSRFDGNRFKDFPIIGNKSASISNILFTNDGKTWVQNFNGQFFCTEKNRLVYQRQLSNLSNFNLGHDFNGEHIAVLANKKVLIYHSKTKRMRQLKIPDSVWISSNNSSLSEFYLNHTNSGRNIRITPTGKVTISRYQVPFKNDYQHWVIDDKDSYFVAKTQKKVFCVKTGKTYDFSGLSSNAFVQNACLITKGKLAILTTNGVILFDAKTKSFRKIFKQYSCSKFIQDREGNWWISTLGDGLLFIPHQETKVYLEGIEVSCLQRMGKVFYLGTKENRIFSYDTQSSLLKLVKQNPENHEVKSLFFNPARNELLFCSVVFHWGTVNQKMQHQTISVNQITQLDAKHYVLCESNNLSVFPIDEKSEWLLWKRKNSKIHNKRLTLFEGNRRFLAAIYYQGEIFAHASDGLWLVDKKKNKKLVIGKNADVIHIFKTARGIIITTGDQGVFRYSNGNVKKLVALSRLLKDQRLYKTKFFNNQFYALTYSGTIVANENGELIQKLMRSDGYPNVDVIDFEMIRNTMYASTTNGFQIIPFPAPKTKRRKPEILLNECFVNGEEFQFKNAFRFSPEENSIHFNLSVIDYRALGNHRVFYSVNGKKWILIEDNKLQLNELAPGNYNIRVFAETEGKNCKSEIKTFNFEVMAPFYKRWWFTGLISLFFLFMGFFIFRYRVRQIQQKNEILQEKLNLEKQLHESSLAAIKSQMNPHFLFNALNTIQSFIYTNEKQAASSYLVDFSELTRKILEMSNKPLVVFSEELEALRLYLKLEKMRFEEDFDFEIDTQNLQHDSFQIPSMLIQPYVENAIKHGLLHKKGEKKLWLHFSISEKVLQVEIKDNGIGLKASKKINEMREKQHESFATIANQKRFELLNQLSDGKIGVEIQETTNEQNEVTGTVVKLSIPIH
jgi:ligand-binding sensor domain-containing protein/two-component sensor histidine kinase